LAFPPPWQEPAQGAVHKKRSGRRIASPSASPHFPLIPHPPVKRAGVSEVHVAPLVTRLLDCHVRIYVFLKAYSGRWVCCFYVCTCWLRVSEHLLGSPDGNELTLAGGLVGLQGALRRVDGSQIQVGHLGGQRDGGVQRLDADVRLGELPQGLGGHLRSVLTGGGRGRLCAGAAAGLCRRASII